MNTGNRRVFTLSILLIAFWLITSTVLGRDTVLFEEDFESVKLER